MKFFPLILFIFLFFPNHTEFDIPKKRHTNFPEIYGSCSKQTKENSLKIANIAYFSNEFRLNTIDNNQLIAYKLKDLIADKEKYIEHEYNFYYPYYYTIKFKKNPASLLVFQNHIGGGDYSIAYSYYLSYDDPTEKSFDELQYEFIDNPNIINLNLITDYAQDEPWIVKNPDNSLFLISKEGVYPKTFTNSNAWGMYDLSVPLKTSWKSADKYANICRIVFNKNINYEKEDNRNGLNDILPDGPLRQIFSLIDKLMGNVRSYDRGSMTDEINYQRLENAVFIWANLLYRPWALQNKVPKYNFNQIKQRICLLANESLDNIKAEVSIHSAYFLTNEDMENEALGLKNESIELCTLYPELAKLYPKAKAELIQYYITNFGYSKMESKRITKELLDIALRMSFNTS